MWWKFSFYPCIINIRASKSNQLQLIKFMKCFKSSKLMPPKQLVKIKGSFIIYTRILYLHQMDIHITHTSDATNSVRVLWEIKEGFWQMTTQLPYKLTFPSWVLIFYKFLHNSLYSKGWYENDNLSYIVFENDNSPVGYHILWLWDITYVYLFFTTSEDFALLEFVQHSKIYIILYRARLSFLHAPFRIQYIFCRHFLKY